MKYSMVAAISIMLIISAGCIQNENEGSDATESTVNEPASENADNSTDDDTVNDDNSTQEEPVDNSTVVQYGDTVTFEYIGYIADMFGNNGDIIINRTGYTLGGIFTTTSYYVVNSSGHELVPSFLPKLHFAYVPKTMTVGQGSVPWGLETGLLNLKENDTAYVLVNPENGFGYGDAENIVNVSLEFEVPVYENLTFDEFEDMYSHEPDTNDIDRIYKHPEYDWQVWVLEVDTPGQRVIMQNLLVLNNTYKLPGKYSMTGITYDWDTVVTDIDTTTNSITLKHEAIVGQYAEPDIHDIQNGAFGGIVTAVNETANTITIDYNLEQYGRCLIYRVEIISIEKH